MKLWVDDVRPAPKGYFHVYSVEQAKTLIKLVETWNGEEPWHWSIIPIELIDLDHDAGDYANDGGDYIRILDWLEETGRDYPIRIHSQNPVGAQNMRRIIERNGWKEVK